MKPFVNVREHVPVRVRVRVRSRFAPAKPLRSRTAVREHVRVRVRSRVAPGQTAPFANSCVRERTHTRALSRNINDQVGGVEEHLV